MFLVWQRVFFTLLLGFSSLKKSDKMRLLRILKQNVEKRENMRYINGKRFIGFNVSYWYSIDFPLKSRLKRWNKQLL